MRTAPAPRAVGPSVDRLAALTTAEADGPPRLGGGATPRARAIAASVHARTSLRACCAAAGRSLARVPTSVRRSRIILVTRAGTVRASSGRAWSRSQSSRAIS